MVKEISFLILMVLLPAGAMGQSPAGELAGLNWFFNSPVGLSAFSFNANGYVTVDSKDWNIATESLSGTKLTQVKYSSINNKGTEVLVHSDTQDRLVGAFVRGQNGEGAGARILANKVVSASWCIKYSDGYRCDTVTLEMCRKMRELHGGYDSIRALVEKCDAVVPRFFSQLNDRVIADAVEEERLNLSYLNRTQENTSKNYPSLTYGTFKAKTKILSEANSYLGSLAAMCKHLMPKLDGALPSGGSAAPLSSATPAR